MDEARLAKLRRQATQAIEGSRGDGFAQIVLELVEHIEGDQVAIIPPEPEVRPAPSAEWRPEPEKEVVSELDPTPTRKRKRKVAEAGGDLSGSD